MNAFLTGSHVYGTPGPESDLDLVLLMDALDYTKLATYGQSILESAHESLGGEAPSLRFGSLNLIVCYSQQVFDVWLQGTQDLIKRSPVTRDEAIEHFNTLRVAAGIKRST